MAVCITGKLNKPANEFQAGESTGFGIQLGVQYYERETRSKQWTNYQVAVFAKKPEQVQFYRDALVEGAIVEVIGQQAKIRQYQGQNGLSLSIELLDARLGYIGFTAQLLAQQQAPQQQRNHSMKQQPTGQQGVNNGQPQPLPNDFDSTDIPF